MDSEGGSVNYNLSGTASILYPSQNKKFETGFLFFKSNIRRYASFLTASKQQ